MLFYIFIQKMIHLVAHLETKDFNSLLSNFKKAKCEVFGISKDSLESHKKFKENIK